MEYKTYMEKKNKFESKSSIIGGIILYGLFTLIGMIIVVYLVSLTEKEFTNVIDHYVSNGKGATIKTRSVINFIYTYLGRIGCIIFLFIGDLLLFYTLFVEICTLRRYLHKEKLFKRGIVSNMDDDYKPQGLFKSLRNLFSKDFNYQNKRKLYSRKELKKMKKELEDLNNSMHGK